MLILRQISSKVQEFRTRTWGRMKLELQIWGPLRGDTSWRCWPCALTQGKVEEVEAGSSAMSHWREGRKKRGREGHQEVSLCAMMIQIWSTMMRVLRNTLVIPLTSLRSSSDSKWKEKFREGRGQLWLQPQEEFPGPRLSHAEDPICRGWISFRSPEAKQDGKHFSGPSLRIYSQAFLLLFEHRRERDPKGRTHWRSGQQVSVVVYPLW